MTGEKLSTGKTLMEFFGKWSGDDAKEIIDLIQRTRSEADFRNICFNDAKKELIAGMTN